jgi:hypothetical protein
MTVQASANWRRRAQTLGMFARSALLAILVIIGSLMANREAAANAAMVTAAATADAGLGACGTNRGKALYDCVANVLDRLSNEISSAKVPETRSALRTAASRLRAAVSKAQALSAISQCRALIAGALRQVRAIGGKYVEGWGGGSGGGSGLQAIVGVLSHAARLIQSKG